MLYFCTSVIFPLAVITINEKSTIASLSELRNKSEEILRSLADHKVILQKHNRPVAVMLSYAHYEHLEKMLDRLEEYTLGLMARQRDKKSASKDFIDNNEW
mgnify:CR=1 FL=1